jgi:hypothetical protein
MNLKTSILILLVILLLLILSGDVVAWTEPKMIGEGEYPVLAQDSSGTYWLVFVKSDGIYTMNSTDLETWNKPLKIPVTRENDYHPWMIIDQNGIFRLVFTRHKIINPHAFFGFDYDVMYTTSKEGIHWSDPVPIAGSNETIDWYPYIYQDSRGKFWVVYSKNIGKEGSMIVLRYSNDGDRWSEEIKAIPPDAIFGKLIDVDGKYWLQYAKYTGNYSITELMNNHDLFIAPSNDGVKWTKAARLTNMPPFNFSLYNDAKTDSDGNLWIAFTSTINGNEEIYIMGSPDGVHWTRPERLSRNIEYINSLENPYNFKCDQKSLFFDQNGNAIVVYQSAIFNNTTLWIVTGKPEIKGELQSVEYNITLPYAPPEEEHFKETVKTPVGIAPIIISLLLTAFLIKRKR